MTYFGLIVRSASSRICRAIATGSASVSTSRAASSQTSCCADRISASTISIARSFRRSNPATRYQTDVRALVWVHGR